MIAILHNIRSAHNVGSILRTCDGAGVQRVYLCGITPTPIDHYGRARSDISKVALGAERSIQWEYALSTEAVIHVLKKEGIISIALERDSHSINIRDYKTLCGIDSLALVVGNEIEGLPQSVLTLCDAIVEIPMYGSKESLNCSVAFGIAVYSLLDRIIK